MVVISIEDHRMRGKKFGQKMDRNRNLRGKISSKARHFWTGPQSFGNNINFNFGVSGPILTNNVMALISSVLGFKGKANTLQGKRQKKNLGLGSNLCHLSCWLESQREKIYIPSNGKHPARQFSLLK